MWCCILFDCPWEPAKTLLSGWGAFLALALFPLSLPCHKICGSLFLVSPSYFLAKLSNNSHSQIIYTHANSFFEWQAKKKKKKITGQECPHSIRLSAAIWDSLSFSTTAIQWSTVRLAPRQMKIKLKSQKFQTVRFVYFYVGEKVPLNNICAPT